MRRWLDTSILVIAILGTVGSIIASRMPIVPDWLPILLTACVSLGLAYFLMLFRLPRNSLAMLAGPSGPEQAYQYFAQRYGIGYGLLDVSWAIKDNGSAILRRKITVEAYSPKDSLDTFLMVPEAQIGRKDDITPIDVKSLTDGCDVSIKDISRAAGKISIELGIDPPLSAGQSVTYEMVELLPQALYAVTEDDVAKRVVDLDYCGWSVNRPTRKLALSVYFPDDHIPEDYGLEVRYASAAPGLPPPKTFQKEEEARLGHPKLSGSEKGYYTLRLDVEYPMVGLIYVLKWQKMKKISAGPEAKAKPSSYSESDKDPCF